MAILPTGEQIAAKLHAECHGERILLSFSTGKDSLACWCWLLEHGFRPIPFYTARIPGLEFVEQTLQRYEEFFGTHIYRTIQPAFYNALNTLTFQPPERAEIIRALNLPEYDFPDIQRGICRTAGLPEDTWCALGVRMADSPNRNITIKTHGPFNETRRTVAIIYDFKMPDIAAILARHNVKLSTDYIWFGRSFDGLDYRYMEAIKRNAPKDFEHIKMLFPWIEAEFARHEFGVRHGQILEK